MRDRSAITHHLTWLVAGLASGLALIVPGVVWLTPAREPMPSTPVLVQPPRQAVRADIAAAVPDPALAAKRRHDEQIERARQLIAKPDVAAARSALEGPARDGEPNALFLLAETFDPNRLAALGVSDVRAEAERARHLYREALAKGHEGARARLEQLK